MPIHEVFSNSQNDASASTGNRPAPSERPSYLFCQDHGLTMANHGASGAMTQDQSYAGYNKPARVADTAVWLLDLLTNDMRIRAQTSLGKQWSKDFMTGCLSHALFGIKYTARSGATSTVGAWVNTLVDNLGMYATANGARKTFNVVGPAISVCWLADYHAGSQGVFQVKIDGVQVDVISINIPFGNTQNGLRYGHAARIYDAGEGTHSVEITCISSGTNAYLSYVAGSGDQTSIPKCYLGTGTKCAGVPDAYSGECRQMVLDQADFLAGLGLPVKSVDTWAIIDPATHMRADGIHWNEVCHVAVKDEMTRVSQEPAPLQTLSWPYAGGGTLVVTIENGTVTGYSIQP